MSQYRMRFEIQKGMTRIYLVDIDDDERLEAFGDRQAPDVRGHVQRLHIGQVEESLALAPAGKTARGLVISRPRIFVVVIGGEEPEKALRWFLVRQKHDGGLCGQARERARLFEGGDFSAHEPTLPIR